MLVTIPEVLTVPEQQELLRLTKELPFVDGKETAGFRAKMVKHNEQVSREAEGRRVMQEIVVRALARSPGFRRAAIPHKIRPPLISRYREGMSYGTHVDDAMMGQGFQRERSDVSVTVFINDASDYDGGELKIHSPFGPQQIKLPARSAVVYPSGTLHEVAKVTRGERLVAVTWVQSYIRDERHRQLLSDVMEVRDRLHAIDPNGKETDLAFRIHTNLTRLWSEG
ncbi:PKHD-type hydroxylase [Dongia mobilis]|uniref:PKHD-type hydroxylase n=1 Tax=Dongia mobilis TaxID=578943 RepID=A0A4R6WWZ1_9PROT|nr:Fe2+-dependent dioxygenase [Dongia mobilis]TDQ84207.1 PKHD-type hydroxylase [Dongia mobilis]